MITADAALIGGTGIGSRFTDWDGEICTFESAFGSVEAKLCHVSGMKILALKRHSGGHKVPPHLVNYRGMATVLKGAGVKICLSTAAVGSLRTDWQPGTLAVCTDMVDLTFRRQTLFDSQVVHTDFTTPFPSSVHLQGAAQELGVSVQSEAVYFGLDGPRYESPAEIKMLQKLGGDVVGMTASTECILMREAGIPYGCLAVVTNLGCGLAPRELHHGEVVDVMLDKGELVIKILLEAIEMSLK